MIYNKQVNNIENGAENSEKINGLEQIKNNTKSRNNDSVFKKPNDYIAKTNFYVKKTIDTKIKQNGNRDVKNNDFDLLRTQKPININNNTSLFIKKFNPPVLKNNSVKINKMYLKIFNFRIKSSGVNSYVNNGKKVIYIEKTEINLQKSGNTSKSNLTSQNETSLTKNINNITQSKQSTIKSISTSAKIHDKTFNIKSKGIDLYRNIAISLEKKLNFNKDSLHSKVFSPIKAQNNFLPVKNSFNSFYVPKDASYKKNKQISFEVNINNENKKKISEVLSQNVESKKKNKSRNSNISLGKNNSDKTPSVKSISFYMKKNKNQIVLNEKIKKKLSDQNSIVKINSAKKSEKSEKIDKIPENSFLKLSANPKILVNANKNKITDKFINNNKINFFKKIEVKPRNVLLKPNNEIKERFLEISSKLDLRDKKNKSIKILSKNSVNSTNSLVNNNLTKNLNNLNFVAKYKVNFEQETSFK